MFLAGYFTRNGNACAICAKRASRADAWRAPSMCFPVLVATGISLVLFFVLKDLGPALVTLFVFLAMFTVARGRPSLAVAAVVLMVAAVAIGYRAGTPHTVVQRIDMWLSPWDNDVHGGDQLAHALWAFATGGPTGSGPGWGDPGVIPAGNTDLVLPAIGEEWGFAGVAAVFALVRRFDLARLRAAQRADTTYGLFLATGLSTLIACEMLLITAGVLGALPLSGVVSPFLSSGNTAMVANFLVFALLASIGNSDEATQPEGLRVPAGRLKWVLAAAGVILLGFAVRYQVLHDSDYLARDAHAFEEDDVKRPQHNPRINSLAREIPRGTIYDRNGIPLATSDWQELERHRDAYAALGVSLETAASRFDSRHYPFGAATAHLTGDLRTGENFHASNASLVEHDANRRLQGYEYAELAPLIRYRHHPDNAGVARILARDRNLRMTVDIRLQLRAKEILEQHLRQAGVADGALVVMEAGTGDVLAAVSAPVGESARRACRAAHAGRTSGSRALRTVSAGLDLQAGDRDRGAARRSRRSRTAPISAGRWATGAAATPSPDGIAPSKTISAITRTAPSIWSAPSRSPATRTSRSLACTTSVRRRWRRRRSGSGSRRAIPRSCATRCPSPPTDRVRCWSRHSRWRAWRPRSPRAARCRKGAGSRVRAIRARTLRSKCWRPRRRRFWRAPCGAW